MFDERKALDMVVYLVAKAGADGLSRAKAIGLMYLLEREALRANRWLVCSDDFVLTPQGPAPKGVLDRMAGSPADTPAAWLERLEWAGAGRGAAEAVVAEERAPYAGAAEEARLVLREPQPECPLPNAQHPGRKAGMPYLGTLSRFSEKAAEQVWSQYGGLGEAALAELLLGLPEAKGRTSGNLAVAEILAGLEFSAAEIEGCLEYVAEMDRLDRFDAPAMRAHGKSAAAAGPGGLTSSRAAAALPAPSC